MKNFPIKIDTQEFWISRSIATVGFIICVASKKVFILVNKRGNGTPDYQGFWNCPCGYLDYHETLKEGCAREIYEETNFKIDPNELHLWSINDDPNDDPKQNVTFRYYAVVKDAALMQKIYAKGQENDEVTDCMWLNVKDINRYDWAFGHKDLIKEILKTLNIKI